MKKTFLEISCVPQFPHSNSEPVDEPSKMPQINAQWSQTAVEGGCLVVSKVKVRI